MAFIRISTGKYGFNLHISLFNINMIFRLFQKFDVEQTVGIRNSTEDGKRLVFLDYDKMLYDLHLKPELKHIQKKYKLSDFYIFESSQKVGAYHIICLDKITAKEWCEIIEQTNVDALYKKVPIQIDNKAWVLRMLPKRASRKPRLKEIMKSKYQTREKSNAHALFLKFNYNINISKIKKLDKYTNVTLTLYDTLNYIKTEEDETSKRKS